MCVCACLCVCVCVCVCARACGDATSSCAPAGERQAREEDAGDDPDELHGPHLHPEGGPGAWGAVQE